MQLTALSAAAIMAATVSAASQRTAVALNKSCDTSKPYTKIINRCPYEVNIWSVFKGDGCPADQYVTLQPGESYAENYSVDDNTGVSIKLSKTKECKGNPITQLEYFLETKSDQGINMNFLDVSYVDCQSDDDDCPTRQEGYYLNVGTDKIRATATSNDEWCPSQGCWDACSCNLISYVNPHDRQTKTCAIGQNMEFYMCGPEGPDGAAVSEDNVKSLFRVPSIFQKMKDQCKTDPFNLGGSQKESSVAQPSTTFLKQTSSSPKPTETESESDDGYDLDAKVGIAAVTPIPKVDADDENKGRTKTKTEVVYVTAYQTVNAKRHVHGHARRHAAINA